LRNTIGQYLVPVTILSHTTMSETKQNTILQSSLSHSDDVQHSKADQLFQSAQECEKKNDIAGMVKHYLEAVEHGHIVSMNKLGNHYCEINNNTRAIQYYEMAIEKGYKNSMFNLAILYSDIGDTINMLKYYHMAKDHGVSDAMVELGKYYVLEEDDKHNAMLYFQMAATHGDVRCILIVAALYYEHGEFDRAMENFILAFEKEQVGPEEIIHYAKELNRIPVCCEALVKMLSTAEGDQRIRVVDACTGLMYQDRKRVHDMIDNHSKLQQKYNEMEKTLKQKEDYIQELELMPEGPQYAAAKQRFNQASNHQQQQQ